MMFDDPYRRLRNMQTHRLGSTYSEACGALANFAGSIALHRDEATAKKIAPRIEAMLEELQKIFLELDLTSGERMPP